MKKDFDSQHEYYERKNKKMIDFYQFFVVLGKVSGFVIIATFLFRLFTKH